MQRLGQIQALLIMLVIVCALALTARIEAKDKPNGIIAKLCATKKDSQHHHTPVLGGFGAAHIPTPTDNEYFWEGVVSDPGCTATLGFNEDANRRVLLCSVANQIVAGTNKKYDAVILPSRKHFSVELYVSLEGNITVTSCERGKA